MARKRKKDTFDLKSFLHPIIDGMSCQELTESGIIRCVSADRIYDALTPEQREEALPILRRMIEADERAAAS
jgi:hypothetical protein